MSTPLVSQAAVLLTQILTQELPASCSLEEIERRAHRRAHEICRAAVEQVAHQRVAAAEARPFTCSCGETPLAQQHRRRDLLTLAGLIRVRLRRYRCPACGQWHAPGATTLDLRPRQRMTRTVEGLAGEYGSAWSFAVAARRLAQVLPGVTLGAKTLERCVARCGKVIAAREDASAAQALEDERTVAGSEPPFAHPARVYVALDGILIRARKAKEWIEIQVGSLWSATREIPGRRHRRCEVLDRTVVARAQGWAALGNQVWRLFVQRGGAERSETEVVVLGDGAAGIRSVWEMHFPEAVALLDPWHLWEKVKQRSREVLGRGEAAWQACQAVWQALKVGAVATATQQVKQWPATSEWAVGQRGRLLGYLDRNRDLIRNYEQLRQEGYLMGAGLMEKQNELVVAPRMKNGKMHWGRSGANGVVLLRSYLLNHPDTPFLPI
jgi:hypothetical protein